MKNTSKEWSGTAQSEVIKPFLALNLCDPAEILTPDQLRELDHDIAGQRASKIVVRDVFLD